MIVISGLTVFTNIFTDDAAAVQGLPTVNVALTEPSKTAKVGPGETGVVTFSGTVRVTLNQATRVVVSLDGSDTWGSAVVSPDSLLFAASGEQPFSVSVRARPRESFSTIGSVTVTGRWVMYPGAIGGAAMPPDGTDGRINIDQFFLFSLKSEKVFIETSPGGQLIYTLTIQNRGNFLDMFSVEILNEDRLNDKHFTVVLAQTNVEIQENPGEEKISIQVNTPLDWTVYKVEHTSVKIQVKSDRGVIEGIPPQTFSFVVREKGFYIPGFDASIMIFSVLFLLIIISYSYKTYGRPRK